MRTSWWALVPYFLHCHQRGEEPSSNVFRKPYIIFPTSRVYQKGFVMLMAHKGTTFILDNTSNKMLLSREKYIKVRQDCGGGFPFPNS
ncbi:hypothetical protein ES332_A08G147600v1 [Gossypium tomentosum]|uniref:Uncharacterized protein n=1 Tax=Gossypium tomentosum TaxID=34277 RepID=A0A5D2PFV7_GOSTO|nr:hypothetical protein ES332_A08G147600v1 [Gossypium tomentosum]